MGFGVSGFGFRVSGLGCRVYLLRLDPLFREREFKNVRAPLASLPVVDLCQGLGGWGFGVKGLGFRV